ncbi:MAG: GNAT family N-acetyltransferase [bacterium]|jgi:GNAT superfamily N-acetyltransferase|nr:GNAT family N-acetyltransferase [bacterium]
MSPLHIQRFSGAEIQPYIPELARLRITVFREFPYLYDGSLAYEEHYLQTYINSPQSMMAVAFDGSTIVGATSALPLRDETPELQQPFVEHGYAIDSLFYFGESVLLPPYRGHGVGVRFFEERESQARTWGYQTACFCAVERPPDHPARPQGYIPLDAFWSKRGYTKHPELMTTMTWKEVGEEAESPKPMGFWLKSLTK